MAKIYQGAGAEDTQSSAELELLNEFKKLPDEFTVVHSVTWITHNSREHGSIGEADFIIAHPSHGILIVEVKGGAIYIEDNKWYSRSKSGAVHEIKDPCGQADRSRRALGDWLRHDGYSPAKRGKNKKWLAGEFFWLFLSYLYPNKPTNIIWNDAKMRPRCAKTGFAPPTRNPKNA